MFPCIFQYALLELTDNVSSATFANLAINVDVAWFCLDWSVLILKEVFKTV